MQCDHDLAAMHRAQDPHQFILTDSQRPSLRCRTDRPIHLTLSRFRGFGGCRCCCLMNPYCSSAFSGCVRCSRRSRITVSTGWTVTARFKINTAAIFNEHCLPRPLCDSMATTMTSAAGGEKRRLLESLRVYNLSTRPISSNTRSLTGWLRLGNELMLKLADKVDIS